MGKKNIVWNDYISQRERFADFFNGMVFQGRQLVLPENLIELDSKLWRRHQTRKSYHEYIRDTVKLWNYEGKRYILSLEPEELFHYALPVKYMNYESLEYDRQYKEVMKRHREKQDLTSDEYLSGFAVSDRLMPVVTIGVYLGERKWNGFSRLSEMTGMTEISGEVKECIAPFLNEFHVNRVDIHMLETSDIFQTDLREVFGFLKRQGNKEKLKRYVEENEGFRHLREDAYDVLSIYGGNENLSLRKEEYRTEGGIDMCTALRELVEDAKEEGRAEMNELIIRLVEDGKTEEILAVAKDPCLQKKLIELYGI